ncbi:transglycosylase domain-containing protein [Catellatospora sp. NPDC049609]|uniref:transglycosylase domain-containing protein n=1 Tax=Catellatospora sp. NPDC049609 TaxID=3155505 RepID=UPI0034243C5E
MTLVDLPRSAPLPPPKGSRRLRIAAIAVALALLAGIAYGAVQYYYAGVPIPKERFDTTHPVRVVNLRPGVADAFVAAVDPDFYQEDPGLIWPSSLIAKKYAVVAMGLPESDLDSWRVRVAAHKLELWYTEADLLGFYLTTARFDTGAIGLAEASQWYLGKEPRDLTVAESALVATHVGAGTTQPEQAWHRVLDTMVERGLLDPAERRSLTFPQARH